MRFDVTAALDELLDRDLSLNRRAVTLFELQVALLSGEMPSAKGQGFSVRVDDKLMLTARLRATLKLLQRAASENGKGDRIVRIATLLAKKGVIDLLDDLLLGEIGFENIRSKLLSPPEFRDQLSAYISQAKCVVAIADVSMRFERIDGKRLTGGVTTALEVVFDSDDSSEEPFYELEGGKRSTRKYCCRVAGAIGMLWLLWKNDFLVPPSIVKKRFASELRRQAKRVDDIKQLAASYRFVATRLNGRNYHCPPLNLHQKIEHLAMELEPLPDRLLDSIRNRGSAASIR